MIKRLLIAVVGTLLVSMASAQVGDAVKESAKDAADAAVH